MFINIESNFENAFYKNKVFSMDPHNNEETIPSQNPNLQNIDPGNLIDGNLLKL